MKNLFFVVFSLVFVVFSTNASAENNYAKELDNIQTQSDYYTAWQGLVEELHKNHEDAYREYKKIWRKILKNNPVDIHALQTEQEKFEEENKALFDLYEAKKEALRTSFEANRVK